MKNKKCEYISVDGQDVICTAVNPPIILGDVIGYSGFTCSVCKQKFDELKKKQDNYRKKEIEDFYNFIMSKK